MKKVFLALAMLTSLSGCIYQSVTTHEIKMGNAICQKKHGVDGIDFSADVFGGERVTCLPGASYLIHVGSTQ